MELIPLPNFFIVKINIEEQKNRKEKVGSLYLHSGEVQMQRNMQHGEIVGIGSNVTKVLPEANVGDVLLFHHFVEGSSRDKSSLIHSDETYNYYTVTVCEFNGRRNETYGVWDGTKITPHKDFIFIEAEKKAESLPMDEYIEKNTTQVGSLILFNDWEETREDKEAKTVRLKEEIKSLSKSTMHDHIKRGIEEKEMEAAKITEEINKTVYKPYKVSYHNPSLPVKENVYSLSAAALTEIEFMDKTYIVTQTKYCVATA